MARVNDDAQWIVLMGFIVSLSFFFLAIVLNQSTVVGQTTAESVLDFPKVDIRDFRQGVLKVDKAGFGTTNEINNEIRYDFMNISIARKNAVVNFTITPPSAATFDLTVIEMHYSNGVTIFDETTYY